MKRGQITLFVILGVVLIAAVAFGLYLSQQFAKSKSVSELAETAELSEAELEAKNTVDACLEDLLSNGILEVFSNGGTLEKSNRVRAAGLNVAVYPKKLPGLNEINGQVGKYIDDNIEICLARNGPELNIRRPGNTEVESRGKDAIARSSIEIIISEESILKDFDAGVEANLKKALEDAGELYGEERETGRFVAMGNTSLNALNKDYLLYTESTGKEKIYVMDFKEILIEGRQLEFAFAIPIEERTIVAGINITEVDTGIFAGIATAIEDFFGGEE